jgi:outer membrane protein
VRAALRASLAAALLGAGCRSYSAESVDALYREALQWSGRDDATPARRPSEAVWQDVEARKLLTLSDAYRITLAQSERIARAAEAFLQTVAAQDQLVAAMLPKLDVQGIQYYQDRVPSSFSSGVVTTGSSHRQVAVMLTQPIFHGLRDFAAFKAAKYSSEAAKNAFETERRLVFQLVAQAFFTTLFFESQLKILENAVKNSSDRLREMRARQAQGIARKTEVLLIETQVASDEAQLNRGRQALELSRTQMAFLLGKPLTVPLSDDLVEPPIPGDPLPLLQRALEERSDLREKRAAVVSAESQIDVVTGEHLPTLDLNADYYLYRERYSDFQQEINWDALLTLTFNVFKGGDIRARTVQAESLFRVAQLNRDELVRQIEADVRSALTTWTLDRDLIGTLETRERTSRENFSQVQTEYRQGIQGVSNLEVLVAQNQYLSAQLELERARLQSKLDWFQLENAQGRIPVR